MARVLPRAVLPRAALRFLRGKGLKTSRSLDRRLARGERGGLHRGADDAALAGAGDAPRARQGARGRRDHADLPRAACSPSSSAAAGSPRHRRAAPGGGDIATRLDQHLPRQHAQRARRRAVGPRPADEEAAALPDLRARARAATTGRSTRRGRGRACLSTIPFWQHRLCRPTAGAASAGFARSRGPSATAW